MNKKEQQELEYLKTILALKIHPEVLPDIKIPSVEEGIVNGYSYNSFSTRITRTCSSFYSHGDCIWNKTTIKGGIEQFSTELLAFQAMLHEISMSCAKKMRDLEIRMENKQFLN